jgi:hypothetical protein
LTNENLDSGRPVQYGNYKMADGAYERLLEKLVERKSTVVPADLQINIVSFYRGPQPKSIARLLARLKLNRSEIAK